MLVCLVFAAIKFFFNLKQEEGTMNYVLYKKNHDYTGLCIGMKCGGI